MKSSIRIIQAAVAVLATGWFMPAQSLAQTLNILHSFGSSERPPSNLIQCADGTLYGVFDEQSGIFRMGPDGSNYQVILPATTLQIDQLLQGSDGALYIAALGTLGSASGFLVVRMNTDGSGQSVIYDVPLPSDPANVPETNSMGLMQGIDGVLYGAASYGQDNLTGDIHYNGWLFRVNTDGSGAQTLSNRVGNFLDAPFQLPDGSLCGFTLGSDSMGQEGNGMYVVNTDGSNFTVYYPYFDVSSPFEGVNGTVYAATRFGNLTQLNTDGSGYSVPFVSVMNVAFQGSDGEFYGTIGSVEQLGAGRLGQIGTGTDIFSTSICRMNSDGSGFAVLATFTMTQALTLTLAPPNGSLNPIYNQTVQSTGSTMNSFFLGQGGVIYGIGADDALNSDYVFSLTPSVAPPAVAPAITVNPSPVMIALGRSAVFNAAATGSPAPDYQWYLNNVAITRADDPILLVSAATAANAGTYTCVATNSAGSATSAPATLAVDPSGTPGYLSNISARGDVGPTSGNTSPGILFGGFSVSGTGTQQVMIRGLGPGMAYAFPSVVSPTEVVADPQLALYNSADAEVALNNGWSTSGVTAAMMEALGAYAIQPGSQDCALETSVAPGDYTALVSTTGTGQQAGLGSVEIYDADEGASTAKLVNLSARDYVGLGDHLLIGGIVIGGTDADTVLIRAVGPGLADELQFNSVLVQPTLAILNSAGNTIYSNLGGWGGDRTIADVSAQVGAFPLVATHSDAVALLSLAPGSYTALVNGLSGATGQALVDFYEVQ